MRIVFLTHYFPPEVGAPQTRIAALAAGLAARGHDVLVHTGHPHYPAGGLPARYGLPLLRRGRGPGYRVLRTPVLPLANRGTVRRLVDHAAFAAGAVAVAPLIGPADVVVAESPPLVLAAASVLHARAMRAHLVLNVADLWPASAVALGALRPGRALRVAEHLEARAYAAAAAVTAPTRGIVDALERHPAARGRAHHLPPAVDPGRFDPRPRPAAPTAPLRVLYAGTVGLAQGLDTLLDAVAGLGARAELVVAGHGTDLPALRARVATAPELAGVQLLGAVPAAEVPSLYAHADVGVVLLRADPLFHGALPTKLLEVLAAGRPVVLAAAGESADLVRTAGAGIVVAPEDASGLAAALRRLDGDRALAAAYGAAGRAYAVEQLSWRRSLERWSALLEGLPPRGPRRARSTRVRRPPG